MRMCIDFHKHFCIRPATPLNYIFVRHAYRMQRRGVKMTQGVEFIRKNFLAYLYSECRRQSGSLDAFTAPPRRFKAFEKLGRTRHKPFIARLCGLNVVLTLFSLSPYYCHLLSLNVMCKRWYHKLKERALPHFPSGGVSFAKKQ